MKAIYLYSYSFLSCSTHKTISLNYDTFHVAFILPKERLTFRSYRISNLHKPSSQNVNAIELWFRMFSFLHRRGFLFIASSNLPLRGVYGKNMYTNTIHNETRHAKILSVCISSPA